MLLVGHHSTRELKHMAGRLHRSVSPDRRRPSAARVGDVPSAQFASRRSSSLRLVAGCRCRARVHRSVTGVTLLRRHHPATSTITPAPCRVGVPRGALSQYSFGMRSLGFHRSSFNAVRAQPGARADARSSVPSSDGVLSRAAHRSRWTSSTPQLSQPTDRPGKLRRAQ